MIRHSFICLFLYLSSCSIIPGDDKPAEYRITNPDTLVRKFNSKSIWYHTDDFCQIELQPRENLESIRNECEAIKNPSAHKTKSDLPEKIKTAERGIKTADLILLFEKNNFQTNREVYSGSISHPRIAPDALAFTKDTITFYCRFEEGLIKNIFTDVNRPPDPIDEYGRMLIILGQKWNLILVDWQKLDVVELENATRLKSYLAEKYRGK